MYRVYVINKDGDPLMPTTRFNRVRILLETNQAKIKSHHPFTIQLQYEVPNKTQPLYLGIDPGRTNIGLSVIKENGEEQFTIQAETRNKEITNLMKARKQFRQQRRQQSRRTKRRRRARKNNTAKSPVYQRQLPGCSEPITLHDIDNKESRFLNRKRKEGWLTPTSNHLLQTHLNLISKVKRYLPITDIVLELNKFSFMKLENPSIHSYQYQQGKLYSYKGDLHQAVSTEQDHHCLLCDKPINHYHHIIPRSQSGSDTIDNIVGLCESCHSKVHKNLFFSDQIKYKKEGIYKRYQALSTLNQIIPHLINTLQEEYGTHFHIVNGYLTQSYRKQFNIPKDHYLDAYCIASIPINNTNISTAIHPYEIKQFRRHDRQVCHQHNFTRKYIYNGKVVAYNRHKSFGQTEDSLEEFRLKQPKKLRSKIMSQLKVIQGTPAYKNPRRLLPGALLKFQRSKNKEPYYFILKGTTNNYFLDFQGERYNKKYCAIISKNSGLAFI